MTLFDKYRFFIDHPIDGSIQIYPGVNDLVFDDEEMDDFGENIFRRILNTQLVLCNTEQHMTFDSIYALEQDYQNCYKIPLKIEVRCDPSDQWEEKWNGYIPFRSGTWDLDRCNLAINVRPDDPYQCVLDNWDQEKNYLDLPKVIIDTIIGTIETVTVSGQAPPHGAGWTIIEIVESQLIDISTSPPTVRPPTYTITYARECLTTVPPDPSGWTLEGGNYYRSVAVGSPTVVTSSPTGTTDPTITFVTSVTTTTYEIIDIEADNGILFNDVLQFLFPDCGSICSNFFNINADGTAPENVAYTYATAWLHQQIIYQASDVIGANFDTNAINTGVEGGAGAKTWEGFWKDIKRLYNLELWYDGQSSCWRIEHISYRDARRMLDLTQEQYLKCISGLRQYSYEDLDFPRREFFKFKYDTGGVDFDNAYISYDSGCTNPDPETNQNEYKLQCTLTDFGRLYNNVNLQGDQDNYEAIVIVSTQGNEINSDIGAISGNVELNAPLSWANLIEALYLHERPLINGNMNGKIYDFLSVKRSKNQPTISIPLCCKDYWTHYSAEDLIKTQFGWGKVRFGSYSALSEILRIDTLHD